MLPMVPMACFAVAIDGPTVGSSPNFDSYFVLEGGHAFCLQKSASATQVKKNHTKVTFVIILTGVRCI